MPQFSLQSVLCLTFREITFCTFHHVHGWYWVSSFINVTGARLLELLETRLGRYKLQHARGPKIFHVVWGENKLYRTWIVSSFSKRDLKLGILEVSATRLKVMPMNNAWQRGNSCLELFVEQQSARACLTSLIWRLANGSRRKQERKKLGGGWDNRRKAKIKAVLYSDMESFSVIRYKAEGKSLQA